MHPNRILLLCLLLSLATRAGAEDRPVTVQIDCRESIGLLPSMWRGIKLQSGEIPAGFSLHTVCLGSELVAHAWTMRRRGGDFDWGPLDQALAKLRAAHLNVVLALPVPKVPDADWTSLVTETARHVDGKVALIEFLASPDADMATYLDFYEAGVWAAYQVDQRLAVGGPGLNWQSAGIEALIQRCAAHKVPLHTVTWQVDVKTPDDPMRSINAVEHLMDVHHLTPRPEGIITGWRVRPDSTVDALALGLSGLMSTMTADVQAICLDDTTDTAGWTAMRALNPLTGVRLPMVIQAPDGGVSGVTHLESDTVLALFWHSRPDASAPVTVTFTGLPWGDRIRIEQLYLAMGAAEMVPVSVETRPFQEPISVDFNLQGGTLTAIRLAIE